MTLDLEQIFSPERLLKNWQMQPCVNLHYQDGRIDQAIHERHQQLLQILESRFKDMRPLAQILGELETAINQAFPPEGSEAGAELQTKEHIVGLLEQLEELIWALELEQPEKKG